MFKALLLSRTDAGFQAALTDVDEADLPAGEVSLRIEHSAINYKDALAITNRSPIVRRWPMVAGVDGAGVVEQSSHPDFRPGDRVVQGGAGVGEGRWGCLAQRARLGAESLVPLPASLSTAQAMAIGTAGFTAMLCVMAIEEQGVPAGTEVLVTGAAGGVGSFAVALAARLGYRVIASTGRTSEADYLRALGAAEVIDRAELSAPGKPLGKERWGAVVDSVGSHTLASACASTRYGGVVTACGLAQGMDFPATVAPFILRAVKLLGIDSVMAPRPLRLSAWRRLPELLDAATLESISVPIGLSQAIERAPAVLAGQVRGRLVVDVNA